MKKAFMLILTLLMNCSKVVEPVTFGEFFVTNSTDKTIIINALRIGGSEATLLVNSISVDDKAHIFTFADGSGGHVRPSNAFSSFTIYSEIKAQANIIYSRVEDSDWVNEGTDGQGHSVFHLKIQ
jgi:hypothetical protein